MRHKTILLPLAALLAASMLLGAGPRLPAQSEVEQLRKEVVELKAQLQQIVEFQRRLCRTLRDESIVIFPDEPKTDGEKVTRAIEEFKAAVDKANQAMASRNPILNQRADALRKRAEEKLQKLPGAMVIPALKAELESAGQNYMLCSSLMMALGMCGKDSVMPYMDGIAGDKKRPGFLRRIAAEAMLNVNKDKAIDLLVPIAGDTDNKNFPERFYVVYLLSETKDPRVLPMLIRGARTDPDKSARCHHINGLWHYKTPEARATLEWVIANDDYEHARTNALATLQRMLGDEAAYLLMKKYSQEATLKNGTPDYRVRNAAYQTMNRIKMNLQKKGLPIPGEPKKEDKKAGAKK